MTFTEIVTEVAERLGRRSGDATTRIGRELNVRYRTVTGELGLAESIRDVRAATTTLGDRFLTFDNTQKIHSVFDTSDGGMRVLKEITVDQMRQLVPGEDSATRYAVFSNTATTVTIWLDTTPQEEYELNADVLGRATTLSGSSSPAWPEAFHDILIHAVMADEYRVDNDTRAAGIAEGLYEKRLRALRLHLRASQYLKIVQNSQGNSSRVASGVISGGGGGTGTTGGESWTQTGLITFDRDPSAPFAVSSGSAMVDDLDAEFLQGLTPAQIAALGGDVDGPASATDNAIARFDGTGGKTLQNSGITIADGASGTLSNTNSGDVTLAGSPDYITIAAQVITRALINLTTHITGRLPFANLIAATGASRLIGRISGSGGGDYSEITVSTGLSMSAGGALTVDAAGSQTANTVYAGPSSGGAAASAFRALVLADLPSGIMQVIDRDVTVNDVNTTTTETTVYSFSVPANTFGTTRALRLTLIGDYKNGSGGNSNLTVRVKLGSTTIASATHTAGNSANRAAQFVEAVISACNATNAQRAFTRWHCAEGAENNNAGTLTAEGGTNRLFSGAHNSIAEDSTGSLTLSVTVQHSVSHADTSFQAHAVQLELL